MNKKSIITVVLLCMLLAFGFVLSACNQTEYTLVYVTNGGTEADSVRFKSGSSVQPAATSKEYFTFDGWYQDEALTQPFTSFGSMPADDVTVYAKWLPMTGGKFVFRSNGGSEVASVTGVTGETVKNIPDDPEKAGYVFGGWYADEACTQLYAFGTYPSGEQTLYAKWNKNPAAFNYVTYVLYDVSTEVPVVSGGKAERPQEENGINCVWYTDKNHTSEFDFTAAVNSDITLYALAYTEGLVFDGAAVKAYNGSFPQVIIPEKFGGVEITEIGSSAFMQNSGVQTVLLPETVTAIGEYAFYKCDYLAGINLGEGITTIGKFAFSDCVRLQSAAELGGLTVVEENIFANCYLLPAVNFGDGLTEVKNYAFTNCKQLKKVKLPDSVEAIFSYAFAETGITSFYIPDNLTLLADGALKACVDLTEIEIGANDRFQVDADSGNLFADRGTTLVLYYKTEVNSTDTSYVVPRKVSKIAAYAFWGNDNLQELDLGSSNNGEGAVMAMGALQKMTALTTLKVKNFDANNKFLAYWFGAETAEQNTSNALYVPATLAEVTFTDVASVAEIPAYAFYGCRGLSRVNGFTNVSSIGNYAFAYTGLESYSVGAAVNQIGVSAFRGCNDLLSVEVDEANTVYASFDGCLYDKTLTKVIYVPAGKTSVTFAESAGEIGAEALYQSNVKDLVIPESVSKIAFGAMEGMKKLTTLTVPFIGGSETENRYMLYLFGSRITPGDTADSVNVGGDKCPSTLTEITLTNPESDVPRYAFTYCTKVETINNDISLTSIGDFAFYKTAIHDADLDDTVNTIGVYAFYDCTNITSVTIGSAATYIGRAAFGGCDKIESIVFRGGERDLTIGDGAFLPKTASENSVTVSYSPLKTLQLSNNIVSIGKVAFGYIGNNYVNSVTEYQPFDLIFDVAASRLQTIGESAFALSAVQNVVLPASVKTIGAIAFGACPLLETVVIGSADHEAAELTVMDDGAFAECAVIKEFTLYKTVTSVSEVPVLGTGTSANTSGLAVFAVNTPQIFVPSGCKDIYATKKGWSDVKDYIQEIR